MRMDSHRPGAMLVAALVLFLVFFVATLNQEASAAEVSAKSQTCLSCHSNITQGVVSHWKGSGHAKAGVGCYECHQANKGDADAFEHNGSTISVIVTPKDCSRCHVQEAKEFGASHHSNAGNILASLDNLLAEIVEGNRGHFSPHSPTPGRGDIKSVNGMASAASGCKQCHGSKVGLKTTDGGMVTVDDLKPGSDGKPTNAAAAAKIAKDADGRPMLHSDTWPNTGIGRLNLDGSRGSCTACHSRHDFSRRRARRYENCGKCHMGPDHPQKEIYEESKHGIAYRDMKDEMNMDKKSWILGKDYAQAPTCATCHMSGNTRNGGRVTHDPGERISWTNRPPVSRVMDTDENHKIVTETDPAKRKALIHDTAANKRKRMKNVCLHCHTPNYVENFYQQYDNLVVLYNEKFAKPGQAIVGALRKNGMITPTQFDDKIEWTWFYLWHHEGRRARHGASMMAPDYTHWHGMYEVADRFYMEFIPEARELVEHARKEGHTAQADAVEKVIDEIMDRPEHQWKSRGASDAADAVRKQMEKRYGKGSGR